MMDETGPSGFYRKGEEETGGGKEGKGGEGKGKDGGSGVSSKES